MSEASSKRQLMIARQHLDNLSDFVSSLVDFLHGAHPNIDRELTQIKKLLSGDPNYSAANKLSLQLYADLTRENKLIQQQNTDTLLHIQTALRDVNKLDGVDDVTKSEINAFINTLAPSSKATQSPIKHFETTLTLFRKALSSSFASQPQSSLAAQQQLHQQITQELQEFLTPYYASNKSDITLLELKQKLNTGLDQNELLECCLAMIRFVIKDVVTEASSASKLIHDIHKGIGKINVGIKTTIDKSKSRLQKRSTHNQDMREQISAIETALTESQEIDQLRLQTQDCLDKMQSSLSATENDERAEQVKMIALLESMQKRLNELENNAEGYKQKLIDQRLHAMTDTLTQLPNRMAYETKIASAFKQAKSTGSNLCLAILDIDHFKSVNDKFGHSVGDKTLKVIASQIKKNLSSTDFLARWGGEEFIALMPNTSLQQCYEKLDALRIAIAKLPFMSKGDRFTVTISIGLSDVSDHSSIESAFEQSDKLLYLAKKNGRNQIQIKDAK